VIFGDGRLNAGGGQVNVCDLMSVCGQDSGFGVLGYAGGQGSGFGGRVIGVDQGIFSVPGIFCVLETFFVQGIFYGRATFFFQRTAAFPEISDHVI
jgi:hypothetical protein